MAIVATGTTKAPPKRPPPTGYKAILPLPNGQRNPNDRRITSPYGDGPGDGDGSSRSPGTLPSSIYNTIPRVTPKTSPALQPGTPQTQMEGIDLTQPGDEESFYDENKGFYTAPTYTEQALAADPFGGTREGTQWFQQYGDIFNQPTAGETYWQSIAPEFQGPTSTTNWMEGNQSALRGPGEGEQYAGTTLEKYGETGIPGTTNRAEEAFQQFQQNRPPIDFGAGLDAYYENAKKRGSESLNRELAARGVYGSGRGLDKLGDMFTGLEAEQANREADFKLRQLAEGRAWDTLMGTMAGSADMSSRLGSQNELAWTQGLGDLAFRSQGLGLDRLRTGLTAAQASDASEIQQALAGGQLSAEAAREALARLGMAGGFAFQAGDEGFRDDAASVSLAAGADAAALGRRQAGQDAASGAQSAQRNRAQDFFLNNLIMGDRLSGIAGAGFDGFFDTDQELLDDMLGMQTGISATNKSDEEREQARQDAEDAAWNQGLMTNGIALAPSTYGISMAPWLIDRYM